MAGIGPFSSTQLLMAIAPTGNFKSSVDTGNFTSALLFFLTATDTADVENTNGDDITVPVKAVDALIIPFRTNAAVTNLASGYSVIYCYPDNG